MNRTIAAIALTILFATPSTRATNTDFPQAAWSLELAPSYVTPIRFSVDHFYNFDIIGGYYLFDNFSINADLLASYVDQPDENAILGGFGFLLRYHFVNHDPWSLFIDAGGGLSYADPQVPEFGTHFNFTAKGGGGISYRLRDDLHLLTGVRYFHVSNGDIHGRENNPSFDGIQLWIGMMWTF